MPARPEDSIVVGGLTPLTTIDFPGELAAVIFCQGCPWRCGYCHNPHLLPRRSRDPVAWETVVDFLKQRRGLLDAVVFSGGEPTLQRGLRPALDQIRALGFKTGLHTAGPYPDRLSAVLPALDWVALDIKAPLADYDRLTGVSGSGDRAWESARRVIASGIEHEIRTTVHPELLPPPALQRLVRQLKALGAARYRLQRCVPENSLDPTLRNAGQPAEIVFATDAIGEQFEDFAVRD